MKSVKTTVWDPVEYLETEKDITLYLEEVFKIGNTELIITAIGDVARARKAMTKAAGVSRTSLYQSLSEDGRPAFETVVKVAESLGYKLTLVPLAR
jgi:probable addiction module antidote protein